MTRRLAAWLAWGTFGLLAVLAVYVIGFAPIGPDGSRLAASVAAQMVGGFVFLGLGALLASRRPRNAVGPLLMTIGVAYSVPFEELAAMLSRFPVADGPWWPVLMLITSLTLVLYLFPLPLLLLLFPTGRVPGPRWRWVLGVELGIVGLTVVMTVLSPTWGPDAIAIANPLHPVGGAWLERAAAVVGGGLFVAIFAMPVLGVVSLLVRYRGSNALERTRIRWLLYAGTLYALMFILSTLLADTPFSTPLFAIGITSLPVAVAIAILRHRLFDIDVIIRRTLQYGVLTVILGGLYFGSVLLVQALLEPVVGNADSPPVVVVTTLVLAALFNPLRVRVQRWIDRSFYRERVDAERALARFAAVARSEVDLGELRGALFGVVGEALQPERMGLWLRASDAETEAGSRAAGRTADVRGGPS